jgi:hypothetical protein
VTATARCAVVVALVAACSNAADPAPDAMAPDSVPPIDADIPDAGVDGAPLLKILVINEVAAAGVPEDWFEVVNASSSPVALADFVFVDVAGDFVKARPLTATTLDPGARHVQEVSDLANGFKLGSDEELWLYRASDQMGTDAVDWAEGQSPVGGSFARIPDTTGDFMTVSPDTQGAPN